MLVSPLPYDTQLSCRALTVCDRISNHTILHCRCGTSDRGRAQYCCRLFVDGSRNQHWICQRCSFCWPPSRHVWPSKCLDHRLAAQHHGQCHHCNESQLLSDCCGLRYCWAWIGGYRADNCCCVSRTPIILTAWLLERKMADILLKNGRGCAGAAPWRGPCA
jgi:hypothetical protein